jgi:hypothetical protein
MPETMRVVSFIELPHRRRRRWLRGLADLALETLDRGGTDR